MKLPKAEQNLGEWQAAIECLILVAEKNGPTMMARIGMMKVRNRHVVREFNPDRKDSLQGVSRSSASCIPSLLSKYPSESHRRAMSCLESEHAAAPRRSLCDNQKAHASICEGSTETGTARPNGGHPPTRSRIRRSR